MTLHVVQQYDSACIPRLARPGQEGSLGQLGTRLLSGDVRGVPRRPVLIGFAGALFVLAVCGFCASHGVGQILLRSERSDGRVDATREPRGDFLQYPAVPVWVVESHERRVRASFWIGTTRPHRRVEEVEVARRVMEHLARVDAVGNEFRVRRFYVGDNQVKELRRSRCGRREPCTEHDGAAGSSRGEVKCPAVAVLHVHVDSPTKLPRVEIGRAVHIGDRKDDDLELHVRPTDTYLARGVSADFGGAHGDLLMALGCQKTLAISTGRRTCDMPWSGPWLARRRRTTAASRPFQSLIRTQYGVVSG